MVLTPEDCLQVIEKTEPDIALTLFRLFDLRTNTKSYIIQCLADSEIQNFIQKKGDRRSPAYGHNSKVIHLPHAYANAKAADGLGWDSLASKPFPPRRLLQTEAETKEKSNGIIQKLKKQLTDQNKVIGDCKAAALALKNENRRLLYDLNMKNFEISQLRFDQMKAKNTPQIYDIIALIFRVFQNILGILLKLIVFMVLVDIFFICLSYKPIFSHINK